MKDFVRRRRWARCSGNISNPLIKEQVLKCLFFYRKCKLTTTGPWQEVPPIPLSDVTVLPCAAASGTIPLWAISNKGDVLCRLGVTALTPAVRPQL